MDIHIKGKKKFILVDGEGEMQIDDERFPVKAGDVICIEDGEFYRVFNNSHLGLYFVCVFDGGRTYNGTKTTTAKT